MFRKFNFVSNSKTTCSQSQLNIKKYIILKKIQSNIIQSNIINLKQNSAIKKEKIICVGQPKTGTKTLKQIFLNLNKIVCKNPQNINNNIILDNNISIDKEHFFKNISYLHKNLEMFDFFHDVPYSFNYNLINEKYPNSKFILTIRNEDEWFNSLLNYQQMPRAVDQELLKIIYKHSVLSNENKTKIIDLYRKYNNDVISYFKDKPDKLLVINVCDKNKNGNEIIQKICTFIKMDVPNNFVFPHENKQKYK